MSSWPRAGTLAFIAACRSMQHPITAHAAPHAGPCRPHACNSACASPSLTPSSPPPQSTCSHEFLYKQAVAATDAFLGMSGKDPSSACCEALVVRIQLPAAASAAELDLDLRDTRLRLTSACW